MTQNPAMQARAVNAWHVNRQVLHAVDVDVPAAGWTCIVGPNGAGKTTLLKVLAGLMPHQGEVSLFNRALTDYPARERAQQLAWLSQHDVAADDVSVYDLVMLGRLPHQHGWGGASAHDHAVVEQCLHTLTLSEWRERQLGSLSGGERQRVLLARALAVQAPVLLMDEPIANVDIPHQADWLQTVKQLTQQQTTVISVLHDLNLAMRADHVLLMHQGRLVIQASPDDPLLHQALTDVFERRMLIHRVADQWVVLPI